MLCELSLPVAEATDGVYKCFLRVSVTVSSLGGLACSHQYEGSGLPSALLLCSGCHLTLLSWLDDLACWHLSLWNS